MQVIDHAQKLHPGKRLRKHPQYAFGGIGDMATRRIFPEYAVISADNTPFVVLLA
jgi:hypothetical protein